MTLGEKIRYARKHCQLSQEQLAQKLCVSRSAIAKWETDKGMPDVENLKMLSRLLNISLDSLLRDDKAVEEPYDLSAYGRGCSKVKKDRMMRRRFPAGKICSLLGRPESLPCSQGGGKDHYLVEDGQRQLFVAVTDTHLQIQPMEPPAVESDFHMDGWHFIRCGYLPEE